LWLRRYRELADGVRHFKESEGGREIMCDAVEEYAEARANVAREEEEKKADARVKKAEARAKKAEARAKKAEDKKAENLAIKMLKAGKYALDEISDLTDLTIDQLKTLQGK
jgi:predicted  nucleic acid-binding Zn-ribbon protein